MESEKIYKRTTAAKSAAEESAQSARSRMAQLSILTPLDFVIGNFLHQTIRVVWAGSYNAMSFIDDAFYGSH